MDIEDFFVTVIIVAIVVILGWLGIAYHENVTAETIEIKKSEFTCTEYEHSAGYRTTLVGKVTVVTPYTIKQCINYKKIK